MLRTKSRILLNGMDRDGWSGMQPSFGFDAELIMCRIWKGPKGTPIAQGVWHEVTLDLPYGQRFAAIKPGMAFTLQLASRELGRGTVLEAAEISGNVSTDPESQDR